MSSQVGLVSRETSQEGQLQHSSIFRIFLGIEESNEQQFIAAIIIKMRVNIKEEMTRYPIFNYSNANGYIDQSEMFKDESIKKCCNPHGVVEKKNQTITNIYDKIITNNNNDPLYPQSKNLSHSQHKSALNSARQSRNRFPSQSKNLSMNYPNTISKFVGELTKSLAKDELMPMEKFDKNRKEKLSLLKRIIEHYNIKASDKKHYSNLIKSYGMNIETVESTDIAIKKDLHPRENAKIRESYSELGEESPEKQFHITTVKKGSMNRKIRPSNSYLMVKEFRESHNFINKNKLEGRPRNKMLNSSEYLSSSQNQKYRSTIEHSSKVIQKPLKLQTAANSIEAKMKKYRQFLFIVNYSNGFYKQLQVQKYENCFKFYVGHGNNSNLIKSLMKKRFWFQETSNPLEANFIWTQLKNEAFYDNQDPCLLAKYVENDEQEEETMQSIFTQLGEEDEKDGFHQKEQEHEHEQDKKYEGISKSMAKMKSRVQKRKKSNRKMLKSKNEQRTMLMTKFNKIVTKAKDFAPSNPLLKIMNKNDAHTYKAIQDVLSFKSNPSFQDKIKACSVPKSIDIMINSKVQNHVPLNGLLGNKKAMYYNLKEYCRLANKNLSDYVPLTFHIKKGLLDEEFKKMSALFMEKKKMKKGNFWIMKPGEFSNRGQGISCTNKLEEVRKRIIKCKQRNRATKGLTNSSLIVQEYIANPLLYNSRKFDIRAFMMVTICNGKVKGYWYQEGYVRTSSFAWSLYDMEDKYIHLTNDAVQKSCEEYGLYEAGNKLTYSELQRYLSTLKGYNRTLNFFELIYPRMREIATDLFRATFMNLDPNKLRDNFEVFGLDFMIDDNFKPWLIEANTNPCLELNCPILERIIPHMLENAIRISIDPLFPPPSNINQSYKYAIPENAMHYNKFELIFDEDEEGALLRRMYKDSRILEQIEQFEEDKEQFEEEGEMIDFQDA